MNNAMPPIVYVIDDDSSIRSGMNLLLTACDFRVRTFGSATHFYQTEFKDEPSCILLDVNMPGLSGLEVQENLNSRNSHIPIIFLTAYGNISMSVRAIKAGADNFLIKPVQKEDLLFAINNALERDATARKLRALSEDIRFRYASLSERELEVLHLVVRGKLNKEIAYELGNSERTVKAHRSSVMEKMQVSSLAELVLIATQLKILDVDSPISNRLSLKKTN
ncbi:response regulator transcription factor [Undibacterium sp. Dicai25W]|uniref:response regulator transcription factor n=1 Tax=Undibacterium sp. Dicai25W TaxID=3413034 RepID=UPI003BEF6D86